MNEKSKSLMHKTEILYNGIVEGKILADKVDKDVFEKLLKIMLAEDAVELLEKLWAQGYRTNKSNQSKTLGDAHSFLTFLFVSHSSKCLNFYLKHNEDNAHLNTNFNDELKRAISVSSVSIVDALFSYAQQHDISYSTEALTICALQNRVANIYKAQDEPLKLNMVEYVLQKGFSPYTKDNLFDPKEKTKENYFADGILHKALNMGFEGHSFIDFYTPFIEHMNSFPELQFEKDLFLRNLLKHNDWTIPLHHSKDLQAVLEAKLHILQEKDSLEKTIDLKPMIDKNSPVKPTKNLKI